MAAGWGPSSTTRQLAGKIAIITGAASGPGRAAAELFAEHGAAIVVGAGDTSTNTTGAVIPCAGRPAAFR